MLIAQMSDTFATVQLDATRILLLNRARTIIIIEETMSARRQPWLNKVLFFESGGYQLIRYNDGCAVGESPTKQPSND